MNRRRFIGLVSAGLAGATSGVPAIFTPVAVVSISDAKVALIKQLMDNALAEHERLWDEMVLTGWRSGKTNN